MDFKQYRGKNILAWLSYNANYEDPYGGVNRVCYVYPRVLMKGADYDLVDPADFPTLGRIEVRIQGGDSAEDVYSDFGSLVNIRINGDPYLNYDGKICIASSTILSTEGQVPKYGLKLFPERAFIKLLM